MTPPDPHAAVTAVRYELMLKAHGWAKIGGGAGGGVFHRTGDPIVIKVSDGDDCYLAFADHAEAHPTSCLPNLAVVHRGEGWAVVHIERLNPLSVSNAFDVGRWWGGFVVARQAGIALPRGRQEWTALVDILRPIATRTHCGLDFKAENVMERPNTGEVVFTDLLI